MKTNGYRKFSSIRYLRWLSSLWVFLCASAFGQSADMVLLNGQIHGTDGQVEALAVEDGVIVAMGGNADVAGYIDEHTRQIDLEGATVLPGLHDMHVHPMGSGMMQRQCQFPQGSPREVVLETIRRCADEKSAGEWISGGQWDAASFGDTPPHKDMLDQVAPENPVALTDISVHSLWVNSRALELAGITAETPDPEGGIIERDASGEPTGVLRETAGGLVRALIPPPTPEEEVAALDWSLSLMLSFGITSFTDAGVDENTLRAYSTLADEGRLKQRVRACQGWNPGMSRNMGDYHARMNRYQRERLRADCIKIALDGVPTDGHTAAMVEPYADSHGSEHAQGLLMVPAEQLQSALIEMDAHGFTVKMHAAGDGAVRAGLDAIEAAREANGFTGNLHDLAHNSFVQMNDIERARDLSATFEMSPYIWYPNPIIPDIVAAVGDERMERFTPVKDALAAGALVVPGSDWAVVPSVNPWVGIETLVTRKAPGGKGEALGAGQSISLEQAIDLFTRNSARQMGMSHRNGELAPGMLADFVVLDRNPFDIDITEVHLINTLMTVIGGEVVYSLQE